MLRSALGWTTPLPERARPPALPPDAKVPALCVVILVVGTRGDVQPFLPIGRYLAAAGHRVRLASHAVFRSFVEENGLEFFPLAGDPAELSAYMTRTGGRILPGSPSELFEDVPRKRKLIAEILASTWAACTQPDPEHPAQTPFVADAIIANPLSFGHIHVAEALGAPLHIAFPMPWTPTTFWPHPLARLRSDRPQPLENLLSWGAIETLLWTGAGDLINEFRENTLDLSPRHLGGHAAGILHERAVPHAYLWSPAFLPPPRDWGAEIDITGWCFLDRTSDWQPPPDLMSFLAAGPPPLYVGFGSCIAEDPAQLTKTVIEAARRAGVRLLLSRGWSGLGNESLPEEVLLLDDCPHDWLFPRCLAVCHHGGAGTIAAGLRAGRPTIVVPFFGDQTFWGERIHAAGAGPAPLPAATLDPEALAVNASPILGVMSAVCSSAPLVTRWCMARPMRPVICAPRCAGSIGQSATTVAPPPPSAKWRRTPSSNCSRARARSSKI